MLAKLAIAGESAYLDCSFKVQDLHAAGPLLQHHRRRSRPMADPPRPLPFWLDGMGGAILRLGAWSASTACSPVILTYAVCWPLEYFLPRRALAESKKAVGDRHVLYTIVSRESASFRLSASCYSTKCRSGSPACWSITVFVQPTLETLIPPLFGHPLLTFFIYALILDFADYWRHRLSHGFRGWYALHALHHAQRQMSFWSDDRNHLLDDLISFLWFGIIGLAIGVPPLQFPLLILLLRFMESLSHANVKISFGKIGERLLVSPRFHRLHHALAGSRPRAPAIMARFFRTGTCCSAPPISSPVYLPTGDARAPEAMATGSYLAQQWSGLKHFSRRPWQAAALVEISGEQFHPAD